MIDLPRTAALLLPLRCHACGRRARRGRWAPYLCRRCGSRVRTRPRCVRIEDLDVIVAYDYQDVLAVLVRALKYRGVTPLAAPLGRALGQALLDVPAGPQWIVPVPLHWSRRWRRGFNQASLLARAVARARPGFRYRPVLCRRRATSPQVGFGPATRRRNVSGAFRARRLWRRRLRGARVIVVDDVATTGSTLRAAAAALAAAGVAEITLAAAVVAPQGRGSPAALL